MNLFYRHRQQRTADEARKWRMAMQVGGAMALANIEVGRPDQGTEMAELAGAASRAATLALIDAEDVKSPGIHYAVVTQIAASAYQMEWQRLLVTDREKWR